MLFNVIHKPTMKILFYLPIFYLLLLSEATYGQRNVTYQSLLQRASQPKVYIDELTFPGNENNQAVNLTVIFRMDNDFMPFIKVREGLNPPDPDFQFFSNIRMGLELYNGFHEESSRKKVKNLDPVARSSWQDTAWTKTFQETRSNKDFGQGAISVDVEPGKYTYMLQLRRGESANEQNSQLRNIELPNFNERDKVSLLILSDFTDNNDGTFKSSLLNFGENVLYGEDFELMILYPKKELSDKLKIELYRLLPGEDQEPSDEIFYSAEIDNQNDIKASGFTVSPRIDDVQLSFQQNEEGYPVSVVTIPNSRFPNSGFRIELKDEEQDTTIAGKTVGSLWLDIPVSLLNLNIATDMLRFIVNDEKIKELKSGSMVEREKKFREFWKEKDPTPNTEFNELMAEYYNRIDYAYQEFSSPQNAGYETDRGEAYILFGPPNDIERRLPTAAPTREIWYYDDRRLVFEATTGFGDFKLVAEQ